MTDFNVPDDLDPNLIPVENVARIIATYYLSLLAVGLPENTAIT